MNTCFNNQFIHLYKQYLVAFILRSQYSSEGELLQVLHKSTTAKQHTSEIIDTCM